MEARNLGAGDVILIRGKKFVIKKVHFENGKVVTETSGGHLTFKPNESVETE